MGAIAITSVAQCRRLERARAWLKSRGQSEELLIVGANSDGANELARAVANDKGAAFGWYRLSISQLAFAIASRAVAASGVVPLSRVGTEAVVARVVHHLKTDAG